VSGGKILNFHACLFSSDHVIW